MLHQKDAHIIAVVALKIVHEQLCWRFPVRTCRHVPGCLGWAVQIFARTGQGHNLQQSVTPARAAGAGAGNSSPPVLVVMTLRSDCVRSPGCQAPGVSPGPLYFPALPRIITVFTGSGSVLPAPRPELVNVRKLGQWQRAKWSDITQHTSCWILYQPG